MHNNLSYYCFSYWLGLGNNVSYLVGPGGVSSALGKPSSCLKGREKEDKESAERWGTPYGA